MFVSSTEGTGRETVGIESSFLGITMDEVTILYDVEDQQVPYLVKIPVPPQINYVTLGDFKNALNKPFTKRYKFFFKFLHPDFGLVKKEITNDEVPLPCYDGYVESWLVHSMDLTSAGEANLRHSTFDFIDQRLTTTPVTRSQVYEASISGVSSVSHHHQGTQRKFTKRRRRRPLDVTMPTGISAFSSTRSSTTAMAPMILSVTIMPRREQGSDKRYLGMSIVGDTNNSCTAGRIHVCSVTEGGAIYRDGRIGPGDLIIRVNDTEFLGISENAAVQILKQVTQQGAPVTIVVAKCPKRFSTSTTIRTEPVCPIDPAAWVAQIETAAETDFDADTIDEETWALEPPSVVSMTTRSMSSPSTLTGSACRFEQSDTERSMWEDVDAMQKPVTGIKMKDRVWLKMVIPKAFIGKDMVDWLLKNLKELKGNRRAANVYALNLLKNQMIRHEVDNTTFSEKCYYVFENYYDTQLNTEFTGADSARVLTSDCRVN